MELLLQEFQLELPAVQTLLACWVCAPMGGLLGGAGTGPLDRWSARRGNGN
jgi:hypothetical protein